MMRGPGYGGMRLMGGMSRDPSIKNHELPKGIVRRVLAYGAPFKRMITVFLITVVAGAALGVLPALLFRSIIDDGVLGGDVPLIIKLSLAVAGMAVMATSAAINGTSATAATWRYVVALLKIIAMLLCFGSAGVSSSRVGAGSLTFLRR